MSNIQPTDVEKQAIQRLQIIPQERTSEVDQPKSPRGYATRPRAHCLTNTAYNLTYHDPARENGEYAVEAARPSDTIFHPVDLVYN